jgi:hypothetical protein
MVIPMPRLQQPGGIVTGVMPKAGIRREFRASAPEKLNIL